jgi:hypothetical protein
MFQQSTLRLAFFTLVLAFAWLSPKATWGQAVANAQMRGQVIDSSGAAVSGATVKMIETEKSVTHTTTTRADGHYTFPNLPVGPYRLEVS